MASADNELFQYSIVSALMDGVANDGIPMNSLLEHGDHGLGTFRHMVGEMIVLDGELYQMKSDGTTDKIYLPPHPQHTSSSSSDLPVISPFAMITRFRPTVSITHELPTKDTVSELLDRLLPGSKNQYVSFRVEGLFRSITVRTSAGQQYPCQGLSELGKNQVPHTFTATRGTLIGFRSPMYMHALSVGGIHLHFIQDDRLQGGHVLSLESVGTVHVTAALLSKVHLDLPVGNRKFDEAPLKADVEGIKVVEG